MSGFHVVYVPIEWCELSIKALRYIIKIEILAHFQKQNKIEGTLITLENVVALLERHQNHIWMKRYNDERSCPYYNDYNSVFVSCISSDTDQVHQQVYVVPRQWLTCENLEDTLYNDLKFYYSKYGKCDGFVILHSGVAAPIVRHSDYFWARKFGDRTEKPGFKDYLTVFVPCVICSSI